MPRKYTKKSSSYKTMKKIAKQVLAKNTETKSHWSGYTLTDIPATSFTTVATSLVDIPAGSAESERDGNKIHLTSVKYDLFFNIAEATSLPPFPGDSRNSLRVIFYIPKQPDVLLGNGQSNWVNQPFNSPIDFDKFTVLKDMFIPLYVNGRQVVRKQGFISFRNKGKRLGLPIYYDNNGATSCTRNRVCVYMVSDSTSPNHPQVNGYVRSFYKDV